MHRLAAADRLITPLLLFVCLYVLTTVLLLWLRLPLGQWTGLIAVTLATILTVGWAERWKWRLGLFVPPLIAVRELAGGALFGAIVVSACTLAIVLSTDVHHAPGLGFPWLEAAAVFVPAALHEELLFRGYAFQKLYQWRPTFALFFASFFFAALHLGNPSVSWLGLANIFLGGILLGLAYARYGRLWFPIGLHLAWNVVNGPVLGDQVSGYETSSSIFRELGSGATWLTGGHFGIEASALMTVAETVAIALLWRGERASRPHPPGVSPGGE